MCGRNFGSLAAVCLVAFFIGCANAAAAKSQSRITFGGVINIRQAPYIVQLRYNNQPFCGGTLVRPKFVVTAAHCFDKLDHTDIVVVAGANTRTDEGEQRKVDEMSIHPAYTVGIMNGDVAILKLESPMPSTDLIKTVGLCSNPVPDDQLIQVAGWGDMKFNGTASNELRRISIPILNHEKCQAQNHYIYKDPRSQYTWDVKITDNMICAYPNIHDACQGDSGGPAIYGDELCGIVSFGAGCSPQGSGIYTDVYNLKGYIEHRILMMSLYDYE